MAPSNQPNYVRNKRKHRKSSSSSDSESSSSSIDLTETASSLVSEDDLDDSNDSDISMNTEKSIIKEKNLIYDKEINTSNIKLKISELKKHVPKWSAVIKYQNKNNVKVTNTCTIDYFLFAFWILFKIKPNFLEQIPLLSQTKIIFEIVSNIDQLNWNLARELWIINIMNYQKKQS